jgi:hypothetical protein
MRQYRLIAGLILASGITPAIRSADGGGRPEPPQSAPTRPADGSAPVHAYDQPVPDFARFHTATIDVLDDETGKPLAGVSVRLFNLVDRRFHEFPTDPQGRLAFTYPYTGDRPYLNLELRKQGYVPLRQGWGFQGEPEAPKDVLTLRLRRGTTMGGIVVHAAERPVEGVTVVMTVTEYGPGKRAANPTGHEIYYEVPSRTGSDGRWRTDSVPPGAEGVQLQLIHPDFVCDGATTLGGTGRSGKLAALRDQSDRQVPCGRA